MDRGEKIETVPTVSGTIAEENFEPLGEAESDWDDMTEPDLYSILCSSAPRSPYGNIAMIAFVIPVPFALGLPHHSTFLIMGDEELDELSGMKWRVTDEGPELPDLDPTVGVSIRVWRPRKSDFIVESLLEDVTRVFSAITGSEKREPMPWSNEDLAGTVLEASTILYLRDEDEDEAAAISRAFDLSIDSIGLFLRTLRIAIDDPRIMPMGMMSLLPSIPYIVRYGESLQHRHIGVFMVHMGASLPSLRTEEISKDGMSKALVRFKHAKYLFPIFSAEDAFARAKRSFFVESDYAATTVFAYSAIEIFCNGLLSLLCWEANTPRSDLVKMLEGQGFESRMRTRFSPILGGNWDFKSKASPIHTVEEVSKTRHRYLHAGAEPSLKAADTALEAYYVVTEYAKERLVAKSYDFPRTTAMILGEPGLRRKNAWTRRFQKLLESVVHEDDWIESFSNWVQNS